MKRLPTLALAAGLLLTAVAAAPPTMPGGGQGQPQPGGPPNPSITPMPAGAPAQGAEPGATASPNPQVLARAKSWFAQLQAGKIDRSQLAPGMDKLTDEQVANVSSQIKSLGTPVTFEQQQTMTQAGNTITAYLLTFGNGQKLTFYFAVDGQGKVSGLQLRPAP
jgi:cytochrome c1